MGGGTAKLLFVIEPSKPLKFGLRTADDPIFNQLHRCTRVRKDQDQHKSSVCIQPLLKGIDHSTMVIGVRAEPGDKSSSRNWGNGAWGRATTVASLEKATRDQRTYPAGYYALRSNPKVVDGQAVTVKPCQWNELDANSSAIDF